MKYSKADLKALGRTAKAVLFAGATTLASGATILMQGQALGPADGAFSDSGVGEYCTVFLARITPRGSLDTDTTKGNTQSTYQSNSKRFTPPLDTLDTLNISGEAAADPNYRFTLKNYVAKKFFPYNNQIPTVFFDCPYPPYDIVSAFGLSINRVETLSLAGRGVTGLGLAYLLRVPSRVCTTELFTNGRSPRYSSYANAVWNLEKLLVNVSDFDTAKLIAKAIFPDSEYYSETLIPLKPSVYGQAQAIESLSLYQHVIPHVGVKEPKENVQRPKENEPATSSRVTTISRLQQLIEDEKRKGNDPRLYDALGQKRSACEPGVNFLETTGRGRNMGKNRNGGRIVSKFVISSNGRRRNTPMH